MLLASPLALAGNVGTPMYYDSSDRQNCPPGQTLAPSQQQTERQPVAGFDSDLPQQTQQPQQQAMPQETYGGKVVPSAKTPKPSKIKSKEKVPAGTVPSAKTPK